MFSYKGVDEDYEYQVGTVEALTEEEAIKKIKEKGILIIVNLRKSSNVQAVNSFSSLVQARMAALENRMRASQRKAAQKKRDARLAKANPENADIQTTEDVEEKTSVADRSPIVRMVKSAIAKANKSIDKGRKGKNNEKVSVDLDEETRKQLQAIFRDNRFEDSDDYPDQTPDYAKVEYNKPSEPHKSVKEGRELNWDLLDKAESNDPETKRRNKLKIKNKELLMFTRRLHIMLSSGVSLLSALTLTRESSDENMSKIMAEVIEEINMGSSFSEALSKFPRVFDTSYVSLISIGETTGELSSCLIDIIKMKEQEHKISKKVKSASIYPAIVGLVLVVMMIGASLFFLPRFEEMFLEQGLNVPIFTEIVFGIAGQIPIIVGVVLVLIIALTIARKKISRVNQVYIGIKDKLLLKIPVVKAVSSSMYMYHFSSTVSMMLKNGIRLSDTLELAGRSVSNIYIRNEIESVGQLMIQGMSFSEAMQSQEHFEDILIQLTKTGEESGQMVFTLTKASEYFEDELNTRVDNLMEMVPPLSIVVIGLVAAPVVIAAYLPILEMSSGAGLDL